MTEYSEYATAETHSRKGTRKASMGSVNGFVTRSFTFEVTIDSANELDYQNADEFIITVNGKIVKRMNSYQAQRMGLIK